MSAPKTAEVLSARVREEVLAGSGLSLLQAARKLPPGRNGAPVNGATLWRWVVDGVNLPGGRRLRLEGCRVSGRWLTSEQALARFIDAQTPNLDAGKDAAPRSPGRRKAASTAAEAELRRAGA
jgi:hypothetical protein